jgi:hypothetical protein
VLSGRGSTRSQACCNRGSGFAFDNAAGDAHNGGGSDHQSEANSRPQIVPDLSACLLAERIGFFCSMNFGRADGLSIHATYGPKEIDLRFHSSAGVFRPVNHRFSWRAGATILVLSTLAFGSANIAFAGNPSDPGTPQGGPGWIMTFDENGNATINGQPAAVIAVDGGVGYVLPGIVVPGSVNVFSPGDIGPNNPNGFSDRLNFQQFDQTHSFLQYQSVLDGAPDGLADVAGLLPADTGFSVIETGPEGNNGFVWTSPADATHTTYIGISDAPEPSTFILGALGLIALYVIGRRRRAAA